MGRLDGKVALVTGGSRGIGRGIALEFAREGANVAVNYRRDEAAARETVEEIERLGRAAIAVQADVAEWSQVERMVDEVLSAFKTFDVVVANSGVASRTQTVWDVDIEHWHRVLGVDLHGAFYTCKATAKHLVDQRHVERGETTHWLHVDCQVEGVTPGTWRESERQERMHGRIAKLAESFLTEDVEHSKPALASSRSDLRLRAIGFRKTMDVRFAGPIMTLVIPSKRSAERRSQREWRRSAT